MNEDGKWLSYFRKILSTLGANWLVPTHANDRGSHKSYNLSEMFVNSTKEDIQGIIDRFYLDFRICGYEDTLKDLQRLL